MLRSPESLVAFSGGKLVPVAIAVFPVDIGCQPPVVLQERSWRANATLRVCVVVRPPFGTVVNGVSVDNKAAVSTSCLPSRRIVHEWAAALWADLFLLLVGGLVGALFVRLVPRMLFLFHASRTCITYPYPRRTGRSVLVFQIAHGVSWGSTTVMYLFRRLSTGNCRGRWYSVGVVS